MSHNRNADDTLLDLTDNECEECGHLHFDSWYRRYIPCPQSVEGCPCPLGIPS